MYTPNHFTFTSEADKIAFMKRYSFATIITVKDAVPIATQLPFYVEDSRGKLLLRSHFGIANEQVRFIEDNISLVIFAEPHAYISPAHYDKHENVPTWNYIAVHAYGRARIIDDEEGKEQLLKETIQFYEKEYLSQWDSLSDKFRKGMMKGIVTFELEVTNLEGKKKLSQNRSAKEQQRIIDHLEQSEHSTEKEIANYMKQS